MGRPRRMSRAAPRAARPPPPPRRSGARPCRPSRPRRGSRASPGRLRSRRARMSALNELTSLHAAMTPTVPRRARRAVRPRGLRRPERLRARAGALERRCPRRLDPRWQRSHPAAAQRARRHADRGGRAHLAGSVARDSASGLQAFGDGKLKMRGNLHVGVGLPLGHERRAGRAAPALRPRGRARRTWRPGEGDPVVMIHGLGGTKASFLPTVVSLARAGYHAIAIDQPGFGDSQKPLFAALRRALHGARGGRLPRRARDRVGALRRQQPGRTGRPSSSGSRTASARASSRCSRAPCPGSGGRRGRATCRSCAPSSG